MSAGGQRCKGWGIREEESLGKRQESSRKAAGKSRCLCLARSDAILRTVRDAKPDPGEYFVLPGTLGRFPGAKNVPRNTRAVPRSHNCSWEHSGGSPEPKMFLGALGRFLGAQKVPRNTRAVPGSSLPLARNRVSAHGKRCNRNRSQFGP
jgi:hypothetical protein